MPPILVTRDLRRIGPVVIVVVGLHAALLATPVRSVSSNHLPHAAGPLQVRMLGAAPLVDTQKTTLADATPRANDFASQVAPPAVEPRPPAVPAPPAEPQLRVAPAAVSPPLPAFGLVVPGVDRDDDYYPRAMLTLAPSPFEAILIDYPAIENDQGHYSSELTLFIDETGRVLRVRVEGAALPRALEEAARNAFIDARFRAGEAEGLAVKSRIRVEVVFDNRPPGGV